MEAMDNLLIHFLKEWPLHSPDLNIIEIIWAVMKRRVERTGPKNVNELRPVVQCVWNGAQLRTINKLAKEMPERVIQVIANEG
jgi:transposase